MVLIVSLPQKKNTVYLKLLGKWDKVVDHEMMNCTCYFSCHVHITSEPNTTCDG